MHNSGIVVLGKFYAGVFLAEDLVLQMVLNHNSPARNRCWLSSFFFLELRPMGRIPFSTSCHPLPQDINSPQLRSPLPHSIPKPANRMIREHLC